VPELTFNGEPVERILVITAHPDDVDFGAAGSVAGWVEDGIDVSYCVVTDGDAGGFDEAVTREQMREIRRAEQTAAASAVGVDDVSFLAYPDGRLTVSLELRRDLTRVIRRVRPQRVVSPSPLRNFERIYPSHPDHLAAGEAALCAIYPDSRNPFAHPELITEERLAGHTVIEAWLMGGPDGDTYVDVTDRYDRKLAALRCHRSQVGERDDLDQMMRGWMSFTAKAGGLPDGRLAEVYRRVPTV
jgi:LmbE family N-acetylglucosaminyl deacetylase